jgi:2OG-Fe(II) oxygenase superfamily
MTELATRTVPATESLADVVANRAWLRRAYPFAHVVARDVFTADFYARLATQVRQLLQQGLSDVPTPYRFSRGMPGYDAYGMSVTEELGEPLSLFVSAPWRDLMADLFGIGRTPYVFAGAHHHAPWSTDGFVHNDFNPVWFPRHASTGIRVPDASCDFKTGAGTLGDDEKVETIRGAVVIFYLLNDGWRPGDGGETGLYASRDSGAEPAVRCPPRDNSLVAFECTPHSYHGFLASRGRSRTSIIMWVHRELSEAAQLYGTDRIERWKS